MSAGGGKYTEITAEIRQRTGAGGVILIVLDGEKGFGFEVQVDAEYLMKLPAVLRTMADDIEADLQNNLSAVIRASKMEPRSPPKASGAN